MRKALRFYSMLFLLSMFSLFTMKTYAQTVWDGTADVSWYNNAASSFDISTPEQLAGVAQLVNNGTTTFSDKTLNLTADLWLNATGDSTNNWIPIGGSPTATGETSGDPKYFRGTFHGHGYTIHNMYCEKSNYFQAGLFGGVIGVTIDSLAMDNPIVISKGMMGAIVGFAGSSAVINITNCMVMNASINGTGGNNIGCIIGANYSNSSGTNVTNCGATGYITGNYIGGLGGNSQYVTYTNCYFAGTLAGAPNGGICGYSGSTNNCYTNYATGSNTHTGETVKSDSYMKSDSILADLGDAFQQDCALNNDYPILAWQQCGVPVTGDLELCAGESTTLEAYGYDSYVWSTGATTASITVTPSTTTDYYVTGTKNDGTLVITDTITVTVYPQAVITATAMPSADGIAHGVITPSSSTVACGSSDVVTLSITPDYGWHISKILVNGQTVREDDPTDGDVVTYTVDPNGTLCDVKVFFSNVYTITSTIQLTNGAPLTSSSLVMPWGDNGVYEGTATEDVVYTFNSTVRYHLTDVLIDGVSQGAITTYTFASLDQTHTVSAIYQDTCGLFSLPIFMDFENSPENGYGSTPACWTKSSTYTAYPYIYNYDQIAHNSNSAMYFSNSPYSGFSQIAMPAIDTVNVASIRDLQVKFWFRTSYTTMPMQVGVMTDPTNTGSFTPVATIYASAANTYEEVTAYMGSYTGNGQYIAFKYSGSEYASGYIDDLEISLAPDCSPVQNLTIDSTNGNGDIYLSWTDGVLGDPISYSVEYRESGETDWIAETATENSYVLNGLPTGTSYEIRVAQDCGDGLTEYVYTSCFLNCAQEDQCNYTLNLSFASSYGSSYARVKIYYNDYLINTVNGNTTLSLCDGINVKLVAEQDYTYSSYSVGFSLTDPFGVPVINFAAGDVPAEGYTFTSSCAAPACTRPINVTAENVLMTSADITWDVDEDNVATGFIVEYGATGFTHGNGTLEQASSSPFVLSNLTPGVSYDVYVYSDCGSDTSAASDVLTFSTPLCDDYCTWTFELNDSYGDGWNGNAIKVYNDSTLVSTITLSSGHDAVVQVQMCNNTNLSLEWVSGSYADETSFTISDAYGIFSQTFQGSDLSGVFFTTAISCAAPSCPRPENVTVVSVDETSATIDWTSDDAISEWLVEYTDANGATTVNVNAHPYTITGLTSNTLYNITIASLCDNATDTSSFTVAVSFRTSCGTIDNLPYTQDFENDVYTENAYDWLACWSRYASNSEHPMYLGNSSYYAHGGNRFIDAHYTPDCFNIAIMPTLNDAIDVNTLTISFYARRTGSTAIFEIGVMDNASDHTTFTVLDTLNPGNDWGFMEYNFVNYTGTGKNIAFRVSNGQSCGIYIDDIILDYTPACVHPTALAANNVTANDAEISWREQGVASAWNVEYGTATFTPGTGIGTAVNATDTFVAISGLTANTTYYVYVQSDCGNGDASEWEGPITFTTPCEAYGIPYSVDFESTSTWSVPACWHKHESPNMYGAVYTYNTLASSGSHSLKVTTNANQYFAFAELPEFSTPFDSLSISFKLYKDQGSRPFFVGVMTNGDVNNITILDTIDDATSSWGDYTVNLNGYTGTSGNIVIGVNADYFDACNFYVDDIVVDYINDCLFPTNVVANNISDVDATITWVERGDATEWEIEYGPAGFTTGNGTVLTATTNPYTLTGLTAGESYDIHVRSICDASGTGFSSWSSMTNFSTSPCAITDQCTYTINMADEFGDGWNSSYLTILQAGNLVETINLTTGYTGTATVSLCDNTPTTFVWNSVGMYDYEASFTVIDPTGVEVVNSGSLSGASTVATITTSCAGSPIVIDTCDVPTGLAVNNIAQTTASAHWTAGGDETSWNLEYKDQQSLNWTSVVVTGTPDYNLTGLTANTQYFVRVQAACDANSTSDWTMPVFFYTLEESVETCPAPTNLTATEVHNEDVVLTWEQEANTATNWDVKYRVHGTSVWSTAAAAAVPFTLTGLTGHTEYDIQVVAHCTNGLTSDPSNTISVTTTNVGINAYDLDKNVSVYPNPTAGQFVIDNAELIINRVEVYDVYGKLLNVVEANDAQVTMDASSYAAGTYFVRVYTENGMVTKRIVKR